MNFLPLFFSYLQTQGENSAQQEAFVKISESLDRIAQAVDSLSETLVSREIEGPRWRAKGYIERALGSLCALAPEDARDNLARALQEDPSSPLLGVAMVWCGVVERRKQALDSPQSLQQILDNDIETALKAVRYVSSSNHLDRDEKFFHLTALFGAALFYREPKIRQEASCALGALIYNESEVRLEKWRGLVVELRKLSAREDEISPVLEAVGYRYTGLVDDLSRQSRKSLTSQTQVSIDQLVQRGKGLVPSDALSRAEALKANVREQIAIAGKIASIEDSLEQLSVFSYLALPLVALFVVLFSEIILFKAFGVSSGRLGCWLLFVVPVMTGVVYFMATRRRKQLLTAEADNLRLQWRQFRQQR